MLLNSFEILLSRKIVFFEKYEPILNDVPGSFGTPDIIILAFALLESYVFFLGFFVIFEKSYYFP